MVEIRSDMFMNAVGVKLQESRAFALPRAFDGFARQRVYGDDIVAVPTFVRHAETAGEGRQFLSLPATDLEGRID